MDEIQQVDDQIVSFVDIQIYFGEYVFVYQFIKMVERFFIKVVMRWWFIVFIVSIDFIELGSGEKFYVVLRKKFNLYGVIIINLVSNGLMVYIFRVNKVIFGVKVIY